MERRYSSQQDGSCVDPLWDPFSTDHVKVLVRRESPSTDDSASRKSTPLTPQEFELLSDSNPFKQDIAEKYGLAYPGITTKSQSHDLLHRSKGFLEADELFGARARRKSTNDADSYSETSQKGLRGRKCFKDSSYAFTGLNDFLLKNQQSIEDSIQKLSDSEADLTRLQRKEFLLKNQKSIEESIQRLENFEKLFPLTKQVVTPRLDEVDVLNTSSGDNCTGRQIPDLLPKDEHINPISFSGDSRGSVEPWGDLIDLTPDDGDPNRPADVQNCVVTTSASPPDAISTSVSASGHAPDPSSRKSYVDDGGETTEVRPHDPYSSIRFEDYNRKQDQSKSLSEGQTSASSDDSFDIPPLLTRSLDIGKSPGFKHGKNSFMPVTAASNDAPVSKVTAPVFDNPAPVYHIKEVTSILELNGSSINEDKDLSVNVIGDEVQAPDAVLTISGDSIDFHFGSSLEETGDSPTLAGDVDPRIDPFQNVPLAKHVHVVHVQEPGSTDLDQRQTSIYSAPVSSDASPSSVAVPGLGVEKAENPLESEILLFDIQQDSEFQSHSSPTLAQGNIGSFERSVSPFSLLEDSEEKTSPVMAGDDKFSSSFYAMFSTTVSSLEDIADPEQGAGGTETREQTPVSQVDEKRSEESIMDEDIERVAWNEKDDIVGFGGDDSSMTHLDETSGDDSVFDDIRNQQSKEELISFVDSMQSSERGDHSPCISKDILFQTKISVGSGDSSRGSISRESMKVNLSQDSSTLDQPDDLSAPPSQSQPEPVVRRNFDVTAVLLPLAECSSTDSMLVNMSSDSLAVTNVKLRDSLSRGPDRGNRNTLSIDLRRRNMLEQTRRRSLPMIMLKNLGKNQPILWSSQSVDENIDVSHRRSSLPSDGPQLEEIQTFKSSIPKLQYEDQKSGSVSSFTSFGKGSSVVENEPQKTVDTSGTKSSTTANEVVAQGVSVDPFQPALDPWGSDVSSEKDSKFEDTSMNSLPWGDDDWASQLSNPFGDNFVRQTVDVQPCGMSEAISKRKDVNTKESIHEDVSLLTSIGAHVSALPESENSNLRIESSKEPAVSPTHSSVFTSFVRNKLQNPLRAFGKFPLKSEGESEPTSFREIIAHADETVEYPKEVIYLEHIKEAQSKVNIAIPPDLVPYEEQYLEPMQCLREVSSESGLSDAACFDATETAPAKVTPEDVGKESQIIKGSPITNRETDPTEKSSMLLQDGLVFETSDFEVHETTEINNQDSALCPISDPPDEENNKIKADIVKADSSSDSDGGDIDALVMEYKQEVSESDDSDIDNIVMAFKVENPEQELQKAAEAEKHRRSAFNKFGKVLNKMQSVTKYMTTKKKDKEPDEKFKSPPTSGRHSRSQSQDEGAESTSPEAKLEQDDAFDLLNKAAEVFKEQTVRKKRTNPASVWRSKTLHTETVEPEAETDCDIVTRAAILFKGFKSKKVNDNDPGDLKPEREDQLSTSTNAILDSTSSEFAIKTDEGEESSSDPFAGSQTETKEPLENLNETKAESDKMEDYPCTPSAFSDSAVHQEPPPDPKKLERVEEAGSAMGDSGFESVIRYAAEQHDTCEEIVTFPSTLSENATETSVKSAILDMCSHDFMDFDVKDEPVLTHTDTEAKPEKNILDAIVSCEVMGTEATQGVTNNVSLNGVFEEVSQPYCVELDSNEALQKDSKETVDKTLDGVPQRSMTVDSELEPESPKILGVLNEQTCDLILSTGYEEVKVGKKGDTAIASDKPDAKVKARKKGHREETNGKLEELAKEISLVEAAGYKDTTGSDKSGADMLDIRPPEYKRLSSESTENQDTMSLTVNCPDSPENGISDSGDGKFSLCCGGNFKIHLNCTAMVKKPERRPSAVIIANKRCAMTEEENMFPMKVSESYRAGLNSSIDKTDVGEAVKMLKGPVAPLRMVQDLKVNEHELNRNFAGSREELLAEAEIKSFATEVTGDAVINKPEATTETAGGEDLQKVTGTESVKTGASEEKSDKMGAEAERNKRVEKRRSILEELDANKETINMYDSVLDELMKRQGDGATGGKKEEVLDSSQSTKSEKSKRYGRVMSESEFDANFGEAIEKCEQKLKEVATQQDTITVINEDMISDPTRYVSDHIITVTPRDMIPGFAMQQSMDVYDNVLYPDVGPPLPERSFRSGIRHVHDKRSARDPHDARSSFTSIVSDSATNAYMHGVRPQGRTKWVSSTPHLSTLDKRSDVITSRTNSFPYLDRSDNVVSTQYGGHVGSATSFNSDSACWGNYARIDDVHDRRSYDSESSTSGLVIPGAGRASTLSDVSDAYIFGEYSTVKDEIPYDRVIRPLNGHGHPLDNAFKFRHFPAAVEDSPYENIKVITSQPVGSHPRYYRSNVDVHGDVTSGFEHYAVIGQPMESKSVQYSGPSSPTGVMKVSCASQTSTESLVGLVRDDASDILEGLPVFEYTLGATLSTHSHLADAAVDFPAMARYSDDKPDLTKQTQSLDRRKGRQKSKTSDPVVKKQTKVTFSRDAVLTDVIDGIKKSEQGAESSSRGLRDIASSTISSIGGGVKEIAKIFHVPFQCCRSSRREKPKVLRLINKPRLSVNKTRPSVNKPSPTVNKPCPTVNKPSPSVNKPSPSVNKPSPSVNKPSLSINKPSLSDNKTRPSVNEPSPSINKTRPSVNKTRPSVNKPSPSVNKPSPSVNKPSPSVNKPSLSVNKTRPSVNEPSPSINKTRPSVNKPSPSVNKTRQSVNKPSPSINKTRPSVNKSRPPINKVNSF